MSLFPLDAVRNASVDREVELVLEDVREEVQSFGFTPQRDPGDVQDILEVYDLARPRLNVLASLLRDLRGTSGADVSTGLGFLPVILGRYGLETVATEKKTEISRFAAEHGIEVRPYCLGRTPPPLERESLDFLVFAEVLEHLKLSPLAVFRELHSLLRPGGRFVLTTPNVARLEHLEALAAGENFLEPFPETVPRGADATEYIEHVREYSVREVVDLAEGAGFTVDRVLMTGWGDQGYNLLANPYANQICVLLASR